MKIITYYLLAKIFIKETITKFSDDESGVVSIEMAVIIPIIAALGLLSYDAAGVFKSDTRGTSALYAVGDTISANASDINCNYLNKLAQISYRAFATGNWARRDREDDFEFGKNGASDFQFQVHGLRVESLTDVDVDQENLRGRVIWSFHRTEQAVNQKISETPGVFVDIPKAYQTPGEFYIFVDGRVVTKAPIGFMNIFGINQIDIKNYFVPRSIPSIELEELNFNTHCRAS